MAIKSLRNLYADKEKTGDVDFIIGKECVRGHRRVLAAISPKYNTQFYGSQPDKGDVKIVGSSPSSFRKFLEFFYLNEIVVTTEVVEEVLFLAKWSLVDEIFESSYRLAITYDIDRLKNLCQLLIEKDTMKAFRSDDFTINCDRDSLWSILKLDTLNCKEIDAFDACIKWAQAACKRSKIDPGNAENLRCQLGEAITQIRFGSMTVEEFAFLQKLCDRFFNRDETYEIIFLIGRLQHHKSMMNLI
ncbi:hypothetical protein HA402_008238 [Bradysia odoriphaga]|nr:hypothetical protein HA402_008238 [Bradysia odoriphaga]